MFDPWPTASFILLAICICIGATFLPGCASLVSSNNFGSGEHQSDPLLDAAAREWQSHQH